MKFMNLIKFPLKLFFWFFVVALILACFLIGFSFSIQIFSAGAVKFFMSSAVFLGCSTISLALSHGAYVYYFIKLNIPLTTLQKERLNDNVYFGKPPGFGVFNVANDLPEIVRRCGYRLDEKIALKAKTLSKRQKYLSTASTIFIFVLVILAIFSSIS